MKNCILSLFLLFSIVSFACDNCKNQINYNETKDFDVVSAEVIHNKKFGTLEFEIKVAGNAGKTTPKPAGQLDGAPVLGYVFVTTLSAEDVGFSATEGIVALALTSHPDFDDTPLWDESGDGNYNNDGVIWHPHWVVLSQDSRVAGGFSVKEFKKTEEVVLPPTNPGMPMYMDSPGFPVVTDGSYIRVSVPAYRIKNKVNFNYDVVACYMQVSLPAGEMTTMDKPMLGVYEVYSVLSKDLSLPYQTK
jgi:hypothetical protein